MIRITTVPRAQAQVDAANPDREEILVVSI